MPTVVIESAAPETLPATSVIKLTPKQKAFADNWLDKHPGYLAAKMAGYSGNYHTLAAMASENLKKPAIAAYISQRLQEKHLSADQVLAELGDIAGYSLDSIAVEGSPVKTWDKLKALELVGKYHKLFTDKIEVETPVDSGRIAREIVGALLELRQQQEEHAQQGVAQDVVPALGDGSEME